MLKKKVVVIGGGNGSAIALVALKQNLAKFDISAVISMSDSGGSSGNLRKELGVLPPGDIMRAILALSKHDFPLLRKIFYGNRFLEVGKLSGHNLGNLFLSLAAGYEKDFMAVVRALEQSVETVGKVYPATLSACNLAVELNNGKIIRTEAAIDKPNYNRAWKIKKAWLEPKAKANKEAVKAIKKADYIILSPGSLYTSLVATLLPIGIKQAIQKTSAKIIYVAGDAFRLNGETGPETLSGTVAVLESFLPRACDYVLYNNHRLNQKERQYYHDNKWGRIKDDKEKIKNHQVITFGFTRAGGGLCSIKLGKKLAQLLK